MRALAEALEDFATVSVVAPFAEQSGTAQSLTLRRPIVVHPKSPRHWAVEGTPADAVIVALHRLLPPRLKRILNRERSNAFTVEMLAEAAEGLRAMEKLSRKDFVLFLEPPSLDARIVNQFALFSMMSSPTARLDDWLKKQSPQLARRIIIPAAVKWEIRDKLDQANITERVLLPGLDGLARWLKRHYMPRR